MKYLVLVLIFAMALAHPTAALSCSSYSTVSNAWTTNPSTCSITYLQLAISPTGLGNWKQMTFFLLKLILIEFTNCTIRFLIAVFSCRYYSVQKEESLRKRLQGVQRMRPSTDCLLMRVESREMARLKRPQTVPIAWMRDLRLPVIDTRGSTFISSFLFLNSPIQLQLQFASESINICSFLNAISYQQGITQSSLCTYSKASSLPYGFHGVVKIIFQSYGKCYFCFSYY